MNQRLIMLLSICSIFSSLHADIIINPVMMRVHNAARNGNIEAIQTLHRIRKVMTNPDVVDIIQDARYRNPNRAAYLDAFLDAAVEANDAKRPNADLLAINAIHKATKFAERAIARARPNRNPHPDQVRAITFPAYACALMQRLFSGFDLLAA